VDLAEQIRSTADPLMSAWQGWQVFATLWKNHIFFRGKPDWQK